MKLLQLASILALSSFSLATPAPVVKGCNHDNVLRAFLNPPRSAEALQFCYAYIGTTPGPGGFIATVNSTVTSVFTEIITTTKTTYDIVTSTATKILLCPAGPTSTNICGIEAYTTQENVILAQPALFAEECKQLCLSDPVCQSFQVQEVAEGEYSFCKTYSTCVDRNTATPDLGGEFTLWDRNCFELSPSGCSPFPIPSFPTPTSPPSTISSTPGSEDKPPTMTPTPTSPAISPTSTPVPLEDLCPPPFVENMLCGTIGYSFQQSDVISLLEMSPLQCHVACLRDIDCWSYQVLAEPIPCQLNRISIDSSITPDQDRAVYFDRNCRENLPDVCFEPEPAPTQTPDVTPSPTPVEPTPTPEPAAPVCGIQGNAPSGQLIDIIPAESPAGCKQACRNILRCLGFSLTSPFQGGCGLWSIGAKDIDPPASSGQYFYDKECEIPGTTVPSPGEIPKPTCNPSPSLICRFEGARLNIVGLIDSAPVESFRDCKEYCAVEPDCLSFSIDPDNRCKLWARTPSDGVTSTPKGGTFFYDKACEIDAPAPDALPPCTTPAPKLHKRQVAVPSYISVTVTPSRITSACGCLVKMPGYTLTAGAVLVTQTLFESTTITRTTTFGALQIDTLTLTVTAFSTANP